MCSLQFIARLNTMQDREKALVSRERALCKASIKYIISLNKLEKKIRENSISAADKMRLQRLEKANRQLRSLKEIEKVALNKCKQENLRLQEEFRLRALEEDRKFSTYREKLQILKKLSNIHINVKALPHFIQGMVICERTQSRNWIPFKFPTNGIDKQQILDKLWSLTQHTDYYYKQWENLICGTPSLKE